MYQGMMPGMMPYPPQTPMFPQTPSAMQGDTTMIQPGFYNPEKYTSVKALLMEHLDRYASAKTFRDSYWEMEHFINIALQFVPDVDPSSRKDFAKAKKDIMEKKLGIDVRKRTGDLIGSNPTKKHLTGIDFLNRFSAYAKRDGVPWAQIDEQDFKDRYDYLQAIWFDLMKLLVEVSLLEWTSSDPVAEAEGRLIMDVLNDLDVGGGEDDEDEDEPEEYERDEEESKEEDINLGRFGSLPMDSVGAEAPAGNTDFHGKIPPLRSRESVWAERRERERSLTGVSAESEVSGITPSIPRKLEKTLEKKHERMIAKAEEWEKDVDSLLSEEEEEEKSKKYIKEKFKSIPMPFMDKETQDAIVDETIDSYAERTKLPLGANKLTEEVERRLKGNPISPTSEELSIIDEAIEDVVEERRTEFDKISDALSQDAPKKKKRVTRKLKRD
jgi:hypothetical protein